MNAGGVPKTCKSSGKALHLVFDRDNLKRLSQQTNLTLGGEDAEWEDRIISVEYTSGGRVSNTWESTPN